GIANRTRRQPGVAISIVSRIEVEVTRVESPAVFVGELERVNYRGVALKRLATAQAVGEDAGYDRPLLGHSGLALDQRGQRHHRIHGAGIVIPRSAEHT